MSAGVEMTREKLSIPRDRVFENYDACLEKTQPDIVILCPSTSMEQHRPVRLEELP